MLPSIATGNVGSALAGEYEVANSLRFDDGSSDYLTFTPSSNGNRKVFTISLWVKRANLGSAQNMLGSSDSGFGNGLFLQFQSDNTLRFGFQDPNEFKATNRLFRDVGAWYHIVVGIDVTQSSNSDKIKIYVNGVQETSFGTDNTVADADKDWNNTQAHSVGRSGAYNSQYFDGYLTEVVNIDGTQLDATSFGEFDDSGIWKPKDVSGLTFGTNGFYLPFENSSALGQDDSGNGNNFTVNNLTSVDQSTDTCTNNFCTLNPLASGGNPTFSEGNLKLTRASSDGSSQKTTFSTIAASSGKWYAEVKIDSVGSNGLIIGFVNVDKSNLPNTSLGTGEDNFSAGIYSNGGPIFYSSGTTFATVGSYSASDILQLAMDIDNGYLYWGKNGTYLNSADPTSGSTGTGGLALSNLTSGDTYTFAIAIRNNATIQMNYGSPPFSISSGNSDGNGFGNFEYAVPSEYYALNSKNLAEFG